MFSSVLVYTDDTDVPYCIPCVQISVIAAKL